MNQNIRRLKYISQMQKQTRNEIQAYLDHKIYNKFLLSARQEGKVGKLLSIVNWIQLHKSATTIAHIHL